MLLCGLWHGASWTFVVWGGVHGLYLIVSRAGRKLRSATTRFLHIQTKGFLWNGVRTLFSFSLVSLAWVFFRSPSLGKAWAYLGNISLRLPRRGVGQLLFLVSLLAVFILAEFLMKNRHRFLLGKKMPAPAQAVLYALFLCLIIILAADTGNEFLYFQF
jgi:alginate O-acetyltransferase complex protein AlgI